MKLAAAVLACLPLVPHVLAGDSNISTPLSSQLILPSNFKPPQVFKNVNLLRNTNLEKGYVKETVNVVIENVDTKPQDKYFIPFEASVIGHVGGLEVRDKKDPDRAAFVSEVVEYDPSRYDEKASNPVPSIGGLTKSSSTQFYRIRLSKPLGPSTQQTLAISYHFLSSLQPLPAAITQQDRQYLQYAFSSYAPSAYFTQKQKTKVKFSGVDVPDFTGEPERQGSTFTYGPYENIPAGATSMASVRYEFTKPVIHTTLLERDVEVSHWGGNIAFEERYWLTNKGAALSNHFSRVTWAATQYYNPPTPAIKELRVPLRIGSMNPYYTDDIGNISTSRFRSNAREALLELKPRYPLFGSWKFPFRIGWDADVKKFLCSVKGDGYVLKVPFLEGPKMSEGVSYEKVVLRVILPEGARYISIPLTIEVTDDLPSL